MLRYQQINMILHIHFRISCLLDPNIHIYDGRLFFLWNKYTNLLTRMLTHNELVHIELWVICSILSSIMEAKLVSTFKNF